MSTTVDAGGAGEPVPMTRRAWRVRCLRRDAIVIGGWIALLALGWWLLHTNASVYILKSILAPSAGPGGGGWGSQVIYLKGSKLSEFPDPIPVRGASVDWGRNIVALGDPSHPFYEEVSFRLRAMKPEAPGITVDQVETHVKQHGVWVPIGGLADRLLGDGSGDHPRVRENRTVGVSHPEHVVAAIRMEWPWLYRAGMAAVALVTLWLLVSTRSIRVYRRWKAGRCTRCGYESMGAELCPECGLRSDAA